LLIQISSILVVVKGLKLYNLIQYDVGIDRLTVVLREGDTEKVIWSLAYFDAVEQDMWMPAQVEIVPEQSGQDYTVSSS
jgi:hypothetical protein